jgi:circadian clock protein KaiC
MKKNKPAAPPRVSPVLVQRPKVVIRKLSTGVRGLDEIMGGGLPEFSFNIIAGTPGCGKTTFAHQFVFANATRRRPALYFTVLGEPAIKMLRYQQQYSFFDETKLGHLIRFVNLSDEVVEQDFSTVLGRIAQEVERTQPGVVVVDSFRTMLRSKTQGITSEMELQSFIQNLALLLTTFQATTFLIGEYSNAEIRENPVFTVADGIIWLSQLTERNSVVRKLQVVKLRGQASVPGLHTIRIGSYGLEAFSRTLGLVDRKPVARGKGRLSTGVPGLDLLMKGGIPAGDSVLLAGPSGTGKSVLATQFIEAGLRAGEAGIIAIFEERPPEYLRRAASLGLDLLSAQTRGKLEVLYLRPLDLSVDEAFE